MEKENRNKEVLMKTFTEITEEFKKEGGKYISYNTMGAVKGIYYFIPFHKMIKDQPACKWNCNDSFYDLYLTLHRLDGPSRTYIDGSWKDYRWFYYGYEADEGKHHKNKSWRKLVECKVFL